jgi:hypothetical protein
MTSQTVLEKMLSDDLSSQFLKEFARRLPVMYLEAESRSINEEIVDEALRPYLFWQTRYALVQSLFISVARECGLETAVVRCESNGFPILVVRCGRFTLTIHHSSKSEESAVLNSSLIRQQHSSINRELIQPSLFAKFDDEKLKSADNIYSNVIFGCRGNATEWNKYGFLNIVMPYVKKVQNKSGAIVDRLHYAASYNYNDILAMVVERENQERQQPQIKVVVPKIKQHKAGE